MKSIAPYHVGMMASWSAPGRRTATAPTPANGYPAARNVLWRVRVALKHACVSQILAHAYHVLMYIIIILYHCFFVIFFQSTTLPSTNRSSSLPWKTSQWPSGTLRSSHVPSSILENTRYTGAHVRAKKWAPGCVNAAGKAMQK